MKISEPEFVFDTKEIGQGDEFNQVRHVSLDGFLKQGQECLIVLPSIHKVSIQALAGQSTKILDYNSAI